jgi:hypothetical protein
MASNSSFLRCSSVLARKSEGVYEFIAKTRVSVFLNIDTCVRFDDYVNANDVSFVGSAHEM